MTIKKKAFLYFMYNAHKFHVALEKAMKRMQNEWNLFQETQL